MNRFIVLAILCAVFVPSAWATNGNDLALNSGIDSGTSAQLDNNGYAGAYITLPAAGSVTVTINAQGTSSNGIDPRMNLVIDDSQMAWDVGAAASNYEQTLELPAGTHFVRAEFNNDFGTARSLKINTLDVTGATISPSNNNANALAAAATYTANYRQGPANIELVGVAPDTPVHVKLKRHDFNFGTTVPGSNSDTVLTPNPAPGSDAANFQAALVANRFNSLSAENAGKWQSNESTRDVLTAQVPNPHGGPNIPLMDRISDYAQDHNMGYRQHNLIWGSQQPSFAPSMLANPAGIDTYNAATNPQGTNLSNKDALFSSQVAPAGTPNAGEPSEINERINYYVRDRAQRFYDIDVYNESYHTGSNDPGASNNYWDVYGVSGIAEIYKEVKDAIQAGGGNARTFVNEYSVLQQQGGDYFANWYLRHIESIQEAGKALAVPDDSVVTGIGFQYYASTSLAAHNAARIYATMQNLAVEGLPIALTEWGVTGTDSATNEANAATILEETTRLVFGMPGATGMTLWNLRNVAGTFAPVGTLYDSNWTIRDTGTRWQSLMSEWDTDVMANVTQNGTIDFTGFYGDYEITVGSQTFNLSLNKGGSAYSLIIAPGDYNGDGSVDAADYVVWRATVGSASDLRADGNGDRMVDDADYAIWQSLFGTTYGGSGAGAATIVPEPTCGALLVLGGALLVGWRAAGKRRRNCAFA